jgi:glucose/arabinose dehydrogenase
LFFKASSLFITLLVTKLFMQSIARFLLVFGIFWFVSLSLNAQHQLPEGFTETKIADQLNPTAMRFAPDGRLFILEKNGRILIVKDDNLLTTPFAILNNVDDFNERGLGGMAFDPNFAQNAYIYLYYTVKNQNRNRISRIKAQGDAMIPNSEEILLDLEPMSGTIHNGGAMAFGADGKLYISVGDGANGGLSQNMNSVLGKFLRINSDGSIPTDNPFFNTLTGINRAIWALGFRNSFSFAIQPSTGKLFANDVGGSSFEEINEIEKGANYGWNLIEGTRPANTSPPANYRDPLYAYNHNLGCAIIGAAFYNPHHSQFPANYLGKYFFADYCAGYIKVFDPTTKQVESTFATGINRPLAFEVSPEGEMYYLERAGMGGGSQQDNTNTTNGTLWKISYIGSGAPNISEQPDDVLVSVGDSASFHISATGSQPLSFQWKKNGENITNATANSLTVKDLTMNDNGAKFSCMVSNTFGSAMSLEAVLSVTTDTRPSPNITLPVAGTKYQAGQTLHFAGTATDKEDGNLSASAFTWWIDFQHDIHNHPGLSPTSGSQSGSFTIPKFGEISANVWYRVYLKVVDSQGLSTTIYRDVFPEKVDLKIESQPNGAIINVDGETRPTPHTFASVVGIARALTAPLSFSQQDRLYIFKQWENGLTTPSRTFDTPSQNATYRAIFDSINLGKGDGLSGRYYNQANRQFPSNPSRQTVDAKIDFDWGGGSPHSSIGNDNFTIRWSGNIEPFFSEEYTFFTTTDDGVRLWIDNQLVIDKWVPQPATEWSGKINLQAHKQYRITLEFFEDGGDAAAKLAWSSARTPKQIVPTSQLYSEENPLALEPLFEAGSFELFPNPAQETLKISFKARKSALTRLQIVDIVGKLVYNQPLEIYPDKNFYTLNMNWLSPGIYFIGFENQAHSRIKVVKW